VLENEAENARTEGNNDVLWWYQYKKCLWKEKTGAAKKEG
jgi:hypothetical protein